MAHVRGRLAALFWSLQSYNWDDYLDLPQCRTDIETTAAWLAQNLRTSARAVLDVGCGTGNYTLALAAHGCQTVGIDFATGMLRRARSNAVRAAVVGPAAARAGSATFRQVDFNRGVPFPSGSFDAVIAVAVLQCAADPVAFLDEVHRVLQPSGLLLLVALDPRQRSRAKGQLKTSLPRLALRGLKALGNRCRSVPRYSRSDLQAFLDRSGYDLVEERTGEGTLSLLCRAVDRGNQCSSGMRAQ